MNEMYFLVKDEDELKDKVWKNFSEKLAGGAALRVQELKVDGSCKRLFKVWTTSTSYSYSITTTPNSNITATPFSQKPWWETTLTC